MLVAARRTGGVGLGLHVRELVQQLGRDHLTAQTPLDQVRRHRERLDHQAVILMGLPDHDGQSEGHRCADDHAQHLQGEGKAVLPAPDPEVAQLQLPLFVQVFCLQLDQPRLSPQEVSGFGWQLGARPRLAKRQGDGGGIGLLQRLLRFGFRLVVLLSHERSPG